MPPCAGWPWRLAMVPGLVHMAVGALLVMAGRMHLPAPLSEPISINLVSETTPQGTNAVQPEVQPQLLPQPASAAQALPMPPPPMPSQMAPALPTPPQAPPQAPPRLQAALVPKPAAQAARGAKIKAHRIANVTVALTHPAMPFADNQAPDYPQAAINAGEQGVVLFMLYVGADGQVKRFQLTQSSGYADLDAHVRAAAMGWRYQPAMRNGVAVPSIQAFFVKFVPR